MVPLNLPLCSNDFWKKELFLENNISWEKSDVAQFCSDLCLVPNNSQAPVCPSSGRIVTHLHSRSAFRTSSRARYIYTSKNGF